MTLSTSYSIPDLIYVTHHIYIFRRKKTFHRLRKKISIIVHSTDTLGFEIHWGRKKNSHAPPQHLSSGPFTSIFAPGEEKEG